MMDINYVDGVRRGGNCGAEQINELGTVCDDGFLSLFS